MRLTEKEKSVIKKGVRALDKDAKIYLFGSRINDNERGGDIDILVISETLTYSDIIKIKSIIFNEIEEQKIDIIITKEIITDPFIKIAYKEGIQLWKMIY